LNLCWMECLGLHNKPKAEVHPGRMLTGPKEEETKGFRTVSRRTLRLRGRLLGVPQAH
jgi:hypothetical protein